jgi:IS5 family transposase
MRLVAGRLIVKHMHNLADEAPCDRWVANPYFQYFCREVASSTRHRSIARH